MNTFIKSFLLSAVMACSTMVALANNPLHRYVKAEGGAYTNDGLTWNTAKSNIQDAINELHDYMNLQGITEGGYVFVQHGTYKPTESTSQDSQQPQYLSFKIYAGINVWGGWIGDEIIPDDADDATIFDYEPKVIIAGPSGNFVLNQYETILDGNLSDDEQSQAKFVWSEERQRYVTTFPSNVYHVVTFATNGFTNGRANPLASPASLNVVTIRGGRAFDSDASADHPYNAYGGGAYMVGNSRMFDSRVSECEATRDGGGIYLDGGGTVSHNIITDCQALGMGIQYGRGGGICIDQAGTVEQSYVLNNVSREGAGLGIYYSDAVKNKYSHKNSIHPYSAICKSSLISNNTATTEAGGIYMDGGGVLDGVTVARNRCNGIGAFINNMLTGQSAGVFMVGKARAYNSVFWGGTIGTASDSYDDIQFGAYNNGQDANKSYLGYVALSNNDLANWSYSSSNSIMSLSTNNESPNASLNYLNYPVFQQPSPTAGVLPNLKENLIVTRVRAYLAANQATITEVAGIPNDEEHRAAMTYAQMKEAGMISAVISLMASQFNISSTTGQALNAAEFMTSLSDGMFYVASYSFKPQSVSSLAGAGVQLSDLPEEAGVDLDAAELTADVLDIAYSPLCDLGCYNTHAQAPNHATGVNYLETNSDGANTMTVFVDPERSSASGTSNIGASWATPFKHLRDALKYIWDYKQKVASGEAVDFAHYQVLVKEGTIHTAATATNERIGVSSIYMIDGVSVYGGYPTELTGTNTQQEINGVMLRRNPITYPSVVSGSFSDAGYETNVGHLVNFCSVNNAIFDGFQLRYGNATGTTTRELGSIVSFDGGGGFVITNAFHYDGVGLAQNAAASIGAMSGNKVRNCIVTGCTARMGAAVFTYAPLSTLAAEFDNCIFHNNSVIYGTDQSVADVVNAGKEHSIVRIVKGANLTFNHCDFIRNVGVGIDAQAGSTLYVRNSVFYANLDRVVQNTNNFNTINPGKDGFAKLCAPIVNGGATLVHGQNNRFDYLFERDQSGDNSTWRFSSEDFFDGVNFDNTSSNNICNLTYDSSDDGNANFTYPLFKNATRNAGLSTEGDITFFGGMTDWMPNAMSPLVNTGLAGVLANDITVVADRTYGGAPDLGAVENSVDQPENPSVPLYEMSDGTLYDDNDQHGHTRTYTNLRTYYVREYDSDTKGGDGSSWNNAINGNAMYDMATGKLAMQAAGMTYTNEMVDSFNPEDDKTSVSVYRLLNKQTNLYMGADGRGTSDINMGLQFVFVKALDGSDNHKTRTYWNGMTVPVYKYYYFLTSRLADDLYEKDDVKYYWDPRASKMYRQSDNVEVGSSTEGYTRVPIYAIVNEAQTTYPVYTKVVNGETKSFYLKEDGYLYDESNTQVTNNLEGYTAVYEECNVRYARQGVGYLQITQDPQDATKFVIGNTNEPTAATEFFLVGDPTNLYVIPVEFYDTRETPGKEQNMYIGLTMADADPSGNVVYGASAGFVINPSTQVPNPYAVWAINASGSTNQYAQVGYRLKSANEVNGVAAGTYVSKTAQDYTVRISNKNTTYTSLQGTSNSESRDILHFEGQIGQNNCVLISTQTSNGSKGFGWNKITESKKADAYYFTLKSESDKWRVSLNVTGEHAGQYTVWTEDDRSYSTWAKANNGTPYLQLTTDRAQEIYWILEPIYSCTTSSNRVNGLQFAIESANAAFRKDHKEHEIWVGKGTYTRDMQTEQQSIDGVDIKFHYTYKLLEGASLYGGFPTVGNPTMQERDPKKYETFLQTKLGQNPTGIDYDKETSNGRVLYQAGDFTNIYNVQSHVDGFTLRYGYLNQAFRLNIDHNLQNIVADAGHNKIKEHVNLGLVGGAGALLHRGTILENCKVTENMCYYNSLTSIRIFFTIKVRDQSGEEFNVNRSGTGGAYHIVGGGVSSLGATIRNCEIVDNRISAYRSSGSTNCVYGAGLYMSEGQVYNTVISGNVIEGSSTIDLGSTSDDIRAGAGVYLYGGSFFNNTVVDNRCDYSVGWSASLTNVVYIPGVFIHKDVEMYNTIIANNTLQDLAFNNYNINSSSGKLIYGYPVACLGANWAMQPDNIKAYNCCIYSSQDTDSQKGYAYINKSKDYSRRETNAMYGEQVAYNQDGNRKVDDVFLCKNNLLQTNPNLTARAAAKPYRQQDSSPTVNTGTQNIAGVTLPELDAAYENRIQDCQIDMGAYEHNYASNITPTEVENDQHVIISATFFVKSSGDYGNATAENAANAACVEKLQRVLDAAGRYKYSHPDRIVNVYLAETSGTNYYRPLRESDPSQSDNVRSWSIMVPHGVNVYGGFDNTFAEANRSVTEHASILDGGYNISGQNTKAYHVVTFTDVVYGPNGLPYLATDDAKARAGQPSSYTQSMSSQAIDQSQFLMFSSHGVSNMDRAVLNGLFIQNGNADGASSANSASKVYTGYGGGAVVPGFASIRNCIIQNNNALYGGGGLYLQKGATICGTIIKGNSAKYGGGVYFEELTQTPTWVNFSTATEQGLLSSSVMQFAQLVNSTVTGNTASNKGGGIYFDNNAHVMSSVIWGNTCGDQANVAGRTNAYSFAKADEITFAKYPFCYSAVENNRLPGANNISVATENESGVRFLDVDHLDDVTKFATASNKIDPYYRLSDFSQLAKVGSSTQSFGLSVQVFGATQQDIFGTPRVSAGFDYVDIGACAIQQEPKNGQDITTILQRLYVAQPKDVDKDAQQAMIESNDPVYSQKGSSFAYPFQTLDEALEYIRNLRMKKSDEAHKVGNIGGVDHYVWEYARNIPFEIIMSKGFYYPTRDIYNVQGESLGNTFLVPEGVSIVGGFDVKELEDNKFYGQYYTPRVYNNTDAKDEHGVAKGTNTYFEVPTEALDNISELMYANLAIAASSSKDVRGYSMQQLTLEDMKSPRPHNDNNVNNLIEPWEFTNQTVLSGKVINSDEAANAYHVISIIADETLVGALPVGYKYTFTTKYLSGDNAGQDIPAVGLEAYNDGVYASQAAGMKAREKGAPIDLNGLQIADGQAYRYSKTAANGYVWMDYYHGGGVMVDGNWIRANGKKYQNQNMSNTVGYHNIPVIMDRCHFTNNKGGYGGAVSANTDIYFSNNSFTSNQAIAYKDAQVVWSVDGEAIALDQSNASRGQTINGERKLPFDNIYYPGNGGAIYSTKQMTAANCMFENNEATNTYDSEPVVFKSTRSVGGSSTYQFGGCGGAVYSGAYAIVQFFNCNFVRNKANVYPCIFARYPNHYKLGTSKTSDPDPNKVTAEPAVAYNKVIGSVFWGNEGTNTTHPFSAQMIMASAPVMSDHDIQNGIPSTQQGAYLLMPDKESGKNAEYYQDIYDQNYAQSLWFCAFEEHTHITPHRDYDVRLSPFSFDKFVERSIREYVYAIYVKKLDDINKAYSTVNNVKTFNYDNEAAYIEWCKTYENQDYNQIIHSDNSHINGPNFTKPSTAAGLAGYMQDADWMPKRINRMTDNGWGYIVQKTKAKDEHGNDILDGVVYDTYIDGQGAERYRGDGAFFTVLNANAKFQKYVAMGDGTYMIFDAKNVSDQSTSKTTINRISKMPTPTVPTFDNQESYAYIDIGVFEFQHQRLGRPLGDVDYIWVAPAEKPENGGAIGTSWLRPTSDIQRAIETLLSNRNGHKKYLYIIEGDYKPFYSLTKSAGSSRDDYNAGFTINTENLNSVALAPVRCDVENHPEDLSKMNVPSLTILGGFSEEVQTAMQEHWKKSDGTYWTGTELQTGRPNEERNSELVDFYAPENYRDPESFPSTFYSDNDESHTMIEIVDARQWYGRAGEGNYAPRLMDNTVIPITIDGINFNNSAAEDNENRIGGVDVTMGSAINYALIEKFNNPKLRLEFKTTSRTGRRSGGSFEITGDNAPVLSDDVYTLDMNNTTVALELDQNIKEEESITVTCSPRGDVTAENTYGVTISDGSGHSATWYVPKGTVAGVAVDISKIVPSDFVGKYQFTVTGTSGYPVKLRYVSLYGAKKEAEEILRPEGANSAITTFNTADGSPKLTISRCKFFGNGAEGMDIPVVNISKKGGKTLIYNSLFYDNNGTAIVGDNVTLVNNTIANNKRGVELTSNGGDSEMHGNVLWNNTNYASEYSLPAKMVDPADQNYSATLFTHNAVTGANPETAWAVGTNNVHLGTKNDDISDGPNFENPATGDYHLKPSIKLLNAIKHTGVKATENFGLYYYNKITTGGNYSSLSNDSITSLWGKAKDLSNKLRLVDEDMDLGAYEYQNKLMGYAFYNPNVTKSGDGTTWERAYGFGNLQNAIDLVAVATKNGSTFGYVFAKGGREGKSTGENIIMRNGVQVYGSIATSYLKEPKKEHDVETGKDVVTVATISEYSIDLRTQRPGLAGPTTDRTIVNQVSSTTGVTTANTVFDGFEVRENLDMHPQATIVNGEYDGNMLVSNTIVNSNPKDGGVNTSKVENTLVYNTLFRGENSQLELQGAHAYAVNVTSQTPLVMGLDGGSVCAVKDNQVVYCREDVTPTSILVDKSGAPMDLNLEFQLTEDDDANGDGVYDNLDRGVGAAYAGYNLGQKESDGTYTYQNPLDYINRYYAVTYSVPGVGDMTNYPITFSDRDLLGNPRLLGTGVDNGAFESWHIPRDQAVTANYYELKLDHGSVVPVDLNGSFTGTENIIAKVRNYPHEGSFIYLEEGAKLVLDASLQKLPDAMNAQAKVVHNGHDEYAVVPGYVMMREGASIYGQGQSFLTNKITVEKSVNKYGDIIALPFPMKYMKTANVIEGTSETNTPKVYAYNGERRSLRDNFYTNGWSQISNDDVIPACEGVRFEPYSRPEGGALDAGDDFIKICFTATGTSVVDYIYAEGGASKTVKLAKHDEYGTTTAEDMGWNCFGSPYLVANFQTDVLANNTYSMNLPHYLYEYHYQMVGDSVTGSGAYLKVPSWEQYDTNDDGTPDTHPTIILGEGVFTQTATFNDYENLVFKAPTYVAPSPSSAPEAHSVILIHTMGGDDEEEEEQLEDKLGSNSYEIRIYVKQSELHVEGLMGGERIAVCSTDGRIETVCNVDADAQEFVTFITPGAHVVRVDNQSVVVMNMYK